MIQVQGIWVGINTAMTNKLVAEALKNGTIDNFGKVLDIRPEVKVSEKSRLDFLIQTHDGPVYIEVKNCSLVEDGQVLFPDAVTARGTKHLRELQQLRTQEIRTAVLFCVQRSDGSCFRPAHEIDPTYSDTLHEVRQEGVMAIAYRATVEPEQIRITTKIPLCTKF